MPYSDYPWQRDTLDRAPVALVSPDVEPLPPVTAEPGLTHQPGFWPGVTIGVIASFLVAIMITAATTFFGRVG